MKETLNDNPKIEIWLGDCLELMKEIPDKSIDLVLTDPPYGITTCEWDKALLEDVFWNTFGKYNIITFGKEPFISKMIVSNLTNFKYCYIWNKVNPSGFQYAKYRPMLQHEVIGVFRGNFYQSDIKYNKIKTKRTEIKIKHRDYSKGKSNPLAHLDNKRREYTDYEPTSLLTFSNADRTNRVHPTQKPVNLMKYLIETHSDENDTILDPFMGSGTTGIACKELGRHFIGIEIEPKYYEIAKKRINNTQESFL